MGKNEEAERLKAASYKENSLKKWGPHLSERQWGTVREDFSENGDAWNYFSRSGAFPGIPLGRMG